MPVWRLGEGWNRGTGFGLGYRPPGELMLGSGEAMRYELPPACPPAPPSPLCRSGVCIWLISSCSALFSVVPAAVKAARLPLLPRCLQGQRENRGQLRSQITGPERAGNGPAHTHPTGVLAAW